MNDIFKKDKKLAELRARQAELEKMIEGSTANV